MSKQSSKVLVIDASIARSAGPPHSNHPTSSNCRNFLENVLVICHRIAMTPEIRREWDEHQSRFAREWLRRMIAKRKLCPLKNLVSDKRLWTTLENIAQTDQQRAQIVKDIHLLEAALASDKIVISLDENTAHKFFDKAAQTIIELQKITWVNPDRIEEEEPISWLKNGAKPDKNRLLGCNLAKE